MAEASNGLWIASLGVGASALLLAVTARAADDCWTGGLPAVHRLEWTCANLSERFLIGLEGTSRAELLRELGTPGRPADDNGLHFSSNALGRGAYGGNLNVLFDAGGRVRVISALVDPPGDTAAGPIHFTWNVAAGWCSDFPRSAHRCDGDP